MPNRETILNAAIGTGILSSGCASIYIHYTHGELTELRVLIALMNLLIGLLIIFRKPVLKAGSLRSNLIVMPSLLLGALMFKLSQPIYWPAYARIIFTAGAFITMISFVSLGRNFSIFPKERSIVSNGTYNIVRHPGYLGELIMVLACTIAVFKIISLVVLPIFIVSMIFRIREEEKLLSGNADYLKYKEKIKWRLIPALW